MFKKEAFLNKMAVRETNDFLTDITLPVAKCLIVGDADKLIPLEAELCLRLQGRINIFRSEPYFLELVPQRNRQGPVSCRIIKKK